MEEARDRRAMFMKKNALEVMIIVVATIALIGFGLSCVFSKAPEIVRPSATTKVASIDTEESIATEPSKKASKKKASQTSVAVTETTINDTVSPTEDDYFPFPDDGPIYTVEPSGFGKEPTSTIEPIDFGKEPIYTIEPSDFDGPIYTIEPSDFGKEEDPYEYDTGKLNFDTEASIAEI